LKPKLDQFLFEHLTGQTGFAAREAFYNAIFNGSAEEKERKLWLVGKDLKPHLQGNDKVTALRHMAFDYKVSIIKTGSKTYYLPFSYLSNAQRQFIENNREEIPLAPAPYFANNQYLNNQNLQNSSWDEMKRAVKYDGASVEIICLNKFLLKSIDELFPPFISATNFGTRNNKGFGCFELTQRNGIAVLLNKKLQSKYWKQVPGLLAVYKCQTNTTDLAMLFQTINEQYQILKSGLNRPGHNPTYVKSLLFQYFSTLNVRWEKRWLKHKFNAEGVMPIIEHTKLPLDIDCTNRWDNEDQNGLDYKYIRAHLGLAEHNEYKKRNPPGGKPFKVKIGHIPRNNVIIDRSSSPIVIKVIYGALYFLVYSSHSILDNESFAFSFRNSSGLEVNHNLPAPSGFDIVGFMDFATQLINQVSGGRDPRPANCRDDLKIFAKPFTRII
jgi:hypothetical protein